MVVRQAGSTWRDEWELLCEGCGYSIEGLPGEGVCPECGKPIVESVLEVRVGSAWQRGPGFWSWLATILACVRSPRASARFMQIESERALRLRRVNILVAAGLLTTLPGVIYGVQLLRGEAPYDLRELTWPWAETAFRWLSLGLLVIGWWCLLALVLAVLTGIETWGVRSFGRLHGMRITPTVARTITAHATVGWVLAAAFVSIGFLIGLLVYEVAMHHAVEPFRGTLMLAPIWMPTVLGLVGLLTFEMIVYTGVRQCRFANRAKPKA